MLREETKFKKVKKSLENRAKQLLLSLIFGRMKETRMERWKSL
jgi:hypothetical protein